VNKGIVASSRILWPSAVSATPREPRPGRALRTLRDVRTNQSIHTRRSRTAREHYNFNPVPPTSSQTTFSSCEWISGLLAEEALAMGLVID